MSERLLSASRKALPVVLGAGSKGIFQIVAASSIYSWADAETSAKVFQYLFFQSALISLLSASGYFRGYSVANNATELSLAMLQHLASSLIFLLVVSVWISISPSTVADLHYIILLAFGVVAVSLSAPLQGAIVRMQSFKHAFLPQAIGAFLGVAVLWFSPARTVQTVLVCILAVQIAIFIFYIFQANNIGLFSFRMAARRSFLPGFLNYIGVGLVNCSGLFVLFFVREYWASEVNAQVAAAVFMIIRFADSVLGIGTQVIVRSNSHVFKTKFPVLLSYLTVISAFTFCAFLIVTSHNFLPLILASGLAQIFVEFGRYPAAVFFVEHAKRFSIGPFAVFNLLPHATVLLLVLALDQFHQSYGMQLYLFCVASISCLIAVMERILRRRPY